MAKWLEFLDKETENRQGVRRTNISKSVEEGQSVTGFPQSSPAFAVTLTTLAELCDSENY